MIGHIDFTKRGRIGSSGITPDIRAQDVVLWNQHSLAATTMMKTMEIMISFPWKTKGAFRKLLEDTDDGTLQLIGLYGLICSNDLRVSEPLSIFIDFVTW